MTNFVTLSSSRLRLRPWREEDRAPFAALNADPRVMEFFLSPLDRRESDAMVDGIEKHFGEHGFGLWAIEVPGVAPFVGFAGLSLKKFAAPFTPCVEVGWRPAFSHWGRAMRPRRRSSRLPMALARARLPRSFPTHR
jgi:RimJ/RimL family protein N-acetyltransferase